MPVTILTAPALLALAAAATQATTPATDRRQAGFAYYVVGYSAKRRAKSETRWSVLSEAAAFTQAELHADSGYTCEVWGPAGIVALVQPVRKQRTPKAAQVEVAEAVVTEAGAASVTPLLDTQLFLAAVGASQAARKTGMVHHAEALLLNARSHRRSCPSALR